MNSETIKTLAADAIVGWTREHNGACRLSIEGGIVVAKEPTYDDRKYFPHLVISRFAQNAGLTNAAWNTVGNELFNLYCKEMSCRTHLKP